MDCCLALRRLPTLAILAVYLVLPSPVTAQQKTYDFDLQGHRGARGLLPENTIAAFDRALELGVHTLELDVVISADGQVVVSHDPVMSTTICSDPAGRPVTEEVRLYDLTYEEISRYDCGLRGNPRFPEQRAMAAAKPLLAEVIAFERERSEALGREPALWNIETKSRPDGDGVMHPGPERFARALYEVVRSGGILERTTFQSFDPRTLQALRARDPDATLSLLVDRPRVALVEENLEVLGFVPDIYSPHHIPLTADIVAEVKSRGMLVLPWTVNQVSRMRDLLEMGVQGIITDYPDRALSLLDGR
ncbi:MAG: hypothetical protein JJ896_12220 [Rhodothermales bacterium]|nr:hypothetical protein [Rhodothermales bacterium]MBO6780410.1 hypothetical protein [Rhodothermales bacterium]